MAEKQGRPKNSKIAIKALSDCKLCKHQGRAYLVAGQQALEIGSTQFKDYIQRKIYLQTETVLSDNSVKEVVSIMRGKALFEAEEKQIYIRVATPDEKTIYIDLVNSRNEAVKITPDGWEIVTEYPVFFYRPSHMLELPIPLPDGNINDLSVIMGELDDNSYTLIRSVLCYYMRGRPGERGTTPIASLLGPSGAGKSTRAKQLKYVVDPGTPEVRTPTKDVRDLFISAKNLHVLVLDNVSHLDAEMQDAICSLVSRGGFDRKKNYTDDDETIFEECKAIILNGISYKSRPDFQSRKIDIELQPITGGERLTEAEIWAETEKVRPSILGGICNALCNALKHTDKINPRDYDLPRLADFGLFSVALERGNGWPEGQTLKALKDNYNTGLQDIAGEEPLIDEIIKFLDGKQMGGNAPLFEGTTGELLDFLNNQTSDSTQKNKKWPSNPTALGSQLTRLKEPLKASGIEYEKLSVTKNKLTGKSERPIKLYFASNT